MLSRDCGRSVFPRCESYYWLSWENYVSFIIFQVGWTDGLSDKKNIKMKMDTALSGWMGMGDREIPCTRLKYIAQYDFISSLRPLLYSIPVEFAISCRSDESVLSLYCTPARSHHCQRLHISTAKLYSREKSALWPCQFKLFEEQIDGIICEGAVLQW